MLETTPSNEKLILALDGLEIHEVFALVEKLPELRWVKVGLELFLIAGPGIVSDLRQRGLRVFLDMKFHDIPVTMKSACFHAARTGAELITVHAVAGKNSLLEAQSAVIDGASKEGFLPPTLLAVTVLTSWSQKNFSEELEINQPIATRVEKLSALAYQVGIGGCVCSPLEVSRLRNLYPEPFQLVTPGIRIMNDDFNDQKRVMTPSGAIASGASKIVVGRPITQAEEPRKMFDIYCEDLARF